MEKTRKDTSEQVDRFREAARELGCDQSEERFDAALRKVAKAPALEEDKPKAKKPPKRAS